MGMHCTSRSIGRVSLLFSLLFTPNSFLTIAHNEHPCLVFAMGLGMGSSKACQVSRYSVCVCVCVCTSAGPIFINCVILALYMFGLYSTLWASFTRLFSVDTGACSVLFCFVVLCCVCLCLLHSVYYLFALQCSQCSNCTAKHIHKYVDMCVCGLRRA